MAINKFKESVSILVDPNHCSKDNDILWAFVFEEHCNQAETETLSNHFETMESSELLERYKLPAKLLQTMCRSADCQGRVNYSEWQQLYSEHLKVHLKLQRVFSDKEANNWLDFFLEHSHGTLEIKIGSFRKKIKAIKPKTLLKEWYGMEHTVLYEYIDTLKNIVDTNDDGLVSYAEWANWITRTSKYDWAFLPTPISNPHEWEKLFYKLSKGKMELQNVQLKEALMARSEHDQTDNRCLVRVVSFMDEDNDGIITFEEWMRYIDNKHLEKETWQNQLRGKYFIIPITIIQLIIGCIGLSDVRVNKALKFDTHNEGAATCHQVWRYFTHVFVHSTWPHLLLNCIGQIFVGLLLEMSQSKKRWASARVAIIYFSGAIFSLLASAMYYTSCKSVRQSPAILGASGGIYALIGGHLACLVLNWKEIARKALAKKDLVSPPCKLCLIALFLILDGFTYALDPGLNVSYFGHFCGFITGFFFGVISLEDVRKEKWERCLKIVFAGMLIIALIILIAMNITNTCA